MLTQAGMTIVAKTGSTAGMRAVLAETAPDVVLAGVTPAPADRGDARSVVESIRLRHPSVGVLVLSADLDAALARTLIRRRPASAGYLLKQPVPAIATLLRAVRIVASGGTFVDRMVIERLRIAPRRPAALDGVSEREREILALMAAGRTNSAICDALCLSPKTVETHVRTIFRKLELPAASGDHRRVLAVLRYLQSAEAARSTTASWATAA